MHFLFDDHVLDVDRRELRRGSEFIGLEPQVFDLLVYLAQNRHRVVSKDDLIAAVWGGRIVSESTLTSRINAARKAIGDSGEQQRLTRTFPRKGFRFVGEVTEPPKPVEPTATAIQPPPSPFGQRPSVRFCATSDGVRIAYADIGEGPPLVKSANWPNHLEYDWQSPIWGHLLRELAARHRLIRYDARGNGLSDLEVEDLSIEAFVRDLEGVIEATGLEKFTLFGISQGCAISVAYAVRHPERVSRLVLYGGYARGRRKRGSQQEAANAEAVVTLMRQGWGQENPAFRQLFTSLFVPGGTPEQMQRFNDLQRISTSPENAVRLREFADEIDVTGLLGRVQAPTLVLHCRDDAVQPFEEGRLLRPAFPVPGSWRLRAATISCSKATRHGIDFGRR